jgi:uncharacterized membrane protein YgcG
LENQVETVGLGTTIGMAVFLLIAALIVVSLFCKLLLIAGLVPGKRSSRVRRVIVWLANVVGEVRVVSDRRSGSSRGKGSSGGGGGGSSGGGGASGDY